MKRGPKPKPTALKLASGTRADRVTPLESQPKPAGKAFPPEHLHGEALAEWDRMAPVLEAMGVLTAADAPMLALYCEAHAEYLHACGKINSKGEACDDGPTVACGMSVKASPFIGIRNAAAARMRSILAEFGCSPSSRSNLTVSAEKPESAFKQYLAKKK